MWFAKWFGGRNVAQEDDEPARHTPPPVSRPPVQPARQSSASKPQSPKKGFDPYNSGAFERRNAWERVSRR